MGSESTESVTSDGVSTGLAALAERVGMTPTGLLYYFGTRERLLREVVAERDRVAQTVLLGEIALTDLRQIGRHNVETAVLTRLYIVLGAESFDPDEPLHEFFVERYDTARSLIRDVLRGDVAAGRVRAAIDLEQLSLEIIAMFTGLETQWLTDPDRIDLAAATDAYIERLAAELAP